jgi:hypothetical protein
MYAHFQRNRTTTSIFADNNGLPIVYIIRRKKAITQRHDSKGKSTSSSTSLPCPKSSGVAQFIASTSRPRNAITDDKKRDKKSESGSRKIELLKDNMYLLNQALSSVQDKDDDLDSDSDSESQNDDGSLFSSTSLPTSSELAQFIVSTSRPRNATTDDKKGGKKGESGARKRELLKDNMHMLNQDLSVQDRDDALDSDSESESESDDGSLSSSTSLPTSLHSRNSLPPLYVRETPLPTDDKKWGKKGESGAIGRDSFLKHDIDTLNQALSVLDMDDDSDSDSESESDGVEV